MAEHLFGVDVDTMLANSLVKANGFSPFRRREVARVVGTRVQKMNQELYRRAPWEKIAYICNNTINWWRRCRARGFVGRNPAYDVIQTGDALPVAWRTKPVRSARPEFITLSAAETDYKLSRATIYRLRDRDELTIYRRAGDRRSYVDRKQIEEVVRFRPK